MLDGKSILVTGGTGSFGQKFVQTLLAGYNPGRLIIFSRDELKQYQMQQRFAEKQYRCLRYFIGDVRDPERLHRALDGIDIVIHAAALKQVPACEYNPIEAVKTNILGASHLINAAIDQGVSQVVALSTDKAASPINLYGATKLCSDKLFIAANSYAGAQGTRFSVVRYGNVVGSRGSVIPLFLEQKKTGRLTITDARMTRFWITLEQGVRFVIDSLARMRGGEIFVPKIPSMNIMDLAQAVCPDCQVELIGRRSGEKIHEVMIPADEAHQTIECDEYFVITPAHQFWTVRAEPRGECYCPDGFSYSSDTNDRWLTSEEIAALLHQVEIEV